MANLLFVYGTLRRGLCNHHIIADQQFLGEYFTLAKYHVRDLGPYPGLTHSEPNGSSIPGELWEVTDEALARLDEFEGVPTLFRRDLIEIEAFPGEVFAYYWAG